MNPSALIAGAIPRLSNFCFLEVIIPNGHFFLSTFLSLFQEVDHAPYT